MNAYSGRGPVARDWFGLDHFQPGPRFTREGSILFLLDEVASTNDFLLGRGQPALGRICELKSWGWSALDHQYISPLKEIEHGQVVVARRQSAGKGRQGRQWVDCGGLHLSVVVPSHRAALDKGFSVWLGLMVVLCLREDFNVDARLKWPNDIMCAERKLGGILLENRIIGQQKAIIAGLGLNLDTRADQFPAALQGRATSVGLETGRKVLAGALAGHVLQRVENEIDRFDEAGWQPWQHAVSCLDCLLGRKISLVAGDEQVEGRAAGIDDDGSLLLENSSGQIRSFPAGEVHIKREPFRDRESEKP